MDKNKKIIVGTIAVVIVIVVIGAYLFIEGHRPPSYPPVETKPTGNITITSEMGIWKPDREAEKIAIEKFRNDMFPDCSNCECDITLIGGYGAPILHQVRAMGKYLPLSSKENITEEEAKNIAITIISKYPDFFGAPHNVEIMNIGGYGIGGYEIYFKPQTYEDIQFCGHSNPVGRITLRTDGSIEDLGWYYYPNVSVPTKPKLTEQEAVKLLSQKFNVLENEVETGGYNKEPCIFPLYHQNEDFWSYHLARMFGVHTKGGGTVYLDMITGEVLFIEPPNVHF